MISPIIHLLDVYDLRAFALICNPPPIWVQLNSPEMPFLSRSQVSHVIDKDGIHFLIYSTEPIAKGCELTIPFDYNYKDW